MRFIVSKAFEIWVPPFVNKEMESTVHILKPRLNQKHSICSQIDCALWISAAGLSCCKICFKNNEEIEKKKMK